MRHRIGMAVVCLHISAALYLLLGIGFMWLFSTQGQTETIIGVVSLVFCLALVAGIEFVVYGLKRRRFWAWIAGVCIFGL